MLTRLSALHSSNPSRNVSTTNWGGEADFRPVLVDRMIYTDELRNDRSYLTEVHQYSSMNNISSERCSGVSRSVGLHKLPVCYYKIVKPSVIVHCGNVTRDKAIRCDRQHRRTDVKTVDVTSQRLCFSTHRRQTEEEIDSHLIFSAL